MLTGFGGHLVSEDFLEQQLRRHAGHKPAARVRSQFRRWRERQRLLGPASSVRTMLEAGAEPLAQVLGFDAVTDVELSADVASATLRVETAIVVLVVTRWGERLDPLWRPAVVQAHQRGASWCLLFNGTHLRLIHATRVFSRRFAEFDLDCAVDDDRAAEAMWTLVSAEAMSSGGASTTNRAQSTVETIVDASERHASVVCRSLRNGVLEASEHVLRALVARPHTQPVNEVFDQALTIVYRMLFLFFAEARSLVPLWHPVYRDSYSLETLREGAIRRSSVGLWDAIRAVTRLAHAGCRAGELRVTPFNGRLFAPSRTPLAERRDLDDDLARRSLVALSTRPSPDREGRERIAYRDLGVEQLGAVYETLLDYLPSVERVPRSRPHREKVIVSLKSGSGARKATGTFYTPQSITGYLIRQALGPLVRNATPEQILNLRVIDPSMGSGAFLVGACTYLADAYEAAALRNGRCHPSDLGPPERAMIRRSVAERCLYGVDLNPMAVQLARLSLWLATLAADRPLSFLDHHLQVGDSLLGTWISRLRHAPTGRRHRPDRLPLFESLPVSDALREALPVRFSLALEPNDTPEQVRSKERALASLISRDTALSRWKRVADLWCARWFAPEPGLLASLFATLSDAILTGTCALPEATARKSLRLAESTAEACRFFHWELEFPEVFFDAAGERRPDGGFDAVIGNPPWDMVRADPTSGRERMDSRSGSAATVRFTRDAGVYSAQSDGHPNRYQLFLERSIALTRPGGRIGLVLPAGLATDHGSARLRRLLFSRCAVEGLVGFENKQAIFPIHRSVRFLLVSATAGSPTVAMGCRLGEVDASVLERDATSNPDSWFTLRVTPALIEKLSGDDLTVPNLRTPFDLAIAERAATLFQPLGADEGWGVHFGRELNATEDRASFGPPGRGLPVIEGKLIDPFRARPHGAQFSVSARDATRHLGDRYQRQRLAYRDVASATNRVTLIAAILPAGSVSTHTVFCLRTHLPIRSQYFLSGLFNSLVVNYLVRLRVTTHVTTSMVERLPIPDRDQAGAAYTEIAAMARCLGRRDDPALMARLNARVGVLYQLNTDEFAHILGTFPLVPRSDRDRAMRWFKEA